MRSSLSVTLIGLTLLALTRASAPGAGLPTPSSAPPDLEATRIGTSDQTAAAETLLSALAGDAVGLTVAVASPEGLVWSAAYGEADREAGVAATPETRMRLYSVAKPMTAVAAARLMQQGRLSPDVAVQRYVPEFPEKQAPVTPMHLARHTSGIRHYSGDAEARWQRRCGSVSEALEIFADDPLVHPPGKRESYSSWGYVLLSAVLEGATGDRYGVLMQELVFEPAGMRSPAIEDPDRSIPDLARFYREGAPGSFVAAEPVDNTCKWGAGAWVATAEDVARFGIAMIDGTLLEPRSAQLFLRSDDTYRAQGIGAGGMAILIVDARHRLAVALLSNAVGEAIGPTLQRTATRLHEIFTTDEAIRHDPESPKGGRGS